MPSSNASVTERLSSSISRSSSPILRVEFCSLRACIIRSICMRTCGKGMEMGVRGARIEVHIFCPMLQHVGVECIGRRAIRSIWM